MLAVAGSVSRMRLMHGRCFFRRLPAALFGIGGAIDDAARVRSELPDVVRIAGTEGLDEAAMLDEVELAEMKESEVRGTRVCRIRAFFAIDGSGIK
jgi:hypothetical protein